MDQVIFKRKSIRKFLIKPVEIDKIEMLLRAAMQAPSAGNQQPWEFLVIQDQIKLKLLSKMSPYAGLIAQAQLAIILLGNENRFRFPENWQHDLGAAAENILLEAVELDLGGVWLSIAPLDERMDYVKKTFELPQNILPYSVIAVGYPTDKNAFLTEDRYDSTRVHYEQF